MRTTWCLRGILRVPLCAIFSLIGFRRIMRFGCQTHCKRHGVRGFEKQSLSRMCERIYLTVPRGRKFREAWHPFGKASVQPVSQDPFVSLLVALSHLHNTTTLYFFHGAWGNPKSYNLAPSRRCLKETAKPDEERQLPVEGEAPTLVAGYLHLSPDKLPHHELGAQGA